MATGITNGFPFRPTLRSPRSTAIKANSSSAQLYSKQLFGLRLKSVVTSDCLPASPSVHRITARFGGGAGPRPGSYGGGGGGTRRSSQQQKKPSDDDDDAPELNISSIKSSTVRLIDGEQNMVGVVSMNQALQMAEDAELDLVILSPDADPPVLRIMDYNKYTYELQKKKREQQKKSVANRMDLKELKMGYNIDSHDYSVRLKAAQKFLKDGDKVKVIVNLKGRENQFRNIAIELIRRFQTDVGELATEESKSFNDRNINIVLVPNKAVQKPPDTPKKKEKLATTEVSAGV